MKGPGGSGEKDCFLGRFQRRPNKSSMMQGEVRGGDENKTGLSENSQKSGRKSCLLRPDP